MIAWSDQRPGDTKAKTSGAHSKGLFIIDKNSNQAVYIMHSTPRYPEIYEHHSKGHQINPAISSNNRIYG